MMPRVLRLAAAVLTAFFALAAGAFAGELLANVGLAGTETGVHEIRYVESDELLYNFRWTAEPATVDGTPHIKYTAAGDNAKDGEARIEWAEESLMQLTPRGIRTVYWTKKSTGDEQMDWKLRYDWAAKKAHYTWNDRKEDKHEQKTISFGDDAIPGDALYFILRGFPFEKGEGTTFKGDIVMTDGSTLGGAIIHRGEETIDTPLGKREAYKLELKPTSFALKLVAPSMYIWYDKQPPHVWLRFDGREEGPLAPRTKNVVVKHSVGQ
ncbi:hypothetical protein K8I61_09675 [bacterium]|nr:hypothetical protein [bacterium]